MSGNDVISAALLVDNIIYAGQTPSIEVLTAAQLSLNNMLSEWNAQGLAIFSIIKQTPFALTSGTADYTIGTGATINVTRPEKIESWRVIDSSGAANGGEPVDAKEFAKRADDNALTAARIEMLNYDAAFPTGTIHLYPIPNGGSLELWVWEQLAQIADFTLTLGFPPGYQNAVIFNLAVEIANQNGREPPAAAQQIAAACKATLGGTNISEQTRVPPEKKVQPRAA